MTHRRAPALAQLLVASLAAAACADAALTESEPPVARDIVDAPRSAAGKGFYFLPPMVPSPTSFSGAFDPAANPVVEVCLPFGKGCSLPLVARFVMGNGADHIRVDATAEHYIVNWQTRNYSLDAARTYRIRVRVGLNDLGYADVKLVRNGNEAKAVDASKFVAVNLGSTQPIKFRIEKGAVVPPGPASAQLESANAASATIGPNGGQLVATGADGTRYTFVVPPGALTSNVAISMTPISRMLNLPLAGGFAGGVHFEPSGLRFQTLAKLTMQYSSTFKPSDLTTLLYSTGGVPASELVPIVQGSAVTLLIPHFTDAAGGMGVAPQQPCTPGASKYDCIEADILWRLAQAMKYIADAQAVGGNSNFTDATNLFREWASAIQAELGEAATADEDGVEAAVSRAMRWNGYAMSLGVDANLLPEWGMIRAAMAQMYKAQIDRQDTFCATMQNLGRRVLGLKYASDAQTASLDMPSPYHPMEVDLWHCGEPVVESITLPSPLNPGEAANLSVNYGISYAGGPATHIRAIKFTLVLTGTTADGTVTEKAAGPHTRSVTPKDGATNVTVQATACFDLPGKNECDTKTLNVPVKQPISVTVSPATNATTKTNTPFPFSATVKNATNTAVTWSADGGTITAAGVFTATAIGDYTVTATSVEDPSKKASAPIKVTADGVARLTMVSCDLGFGGAATSFSAGENMSLPRCSLAAPAATGTVSSSGSGPTGSASASVTTTMSAAGAGDQGKFSKLTVRAATVGTINATGNSVCTDQCSDAMANFTGSIGIVVTADAPVILEVNLISLQACGGNMANGWQAFAQNYNRHSWLGCNTTDVFVIRLGAGQSWDYAIGTEMWLKNAAYGKNGSVGYSMRGTVTLEITVKPQ